MPAIWDKKTVRRRLLYAFVLLAAMSGGIIISGRSVIETLTEKAVAEETRIKASELARTFASDGKTFETIVERGTLTPWQQEIVAGALNYSSIYSFVVFGADGQLIYSTDYGVSAPDSVTEPNASALSALAQKDLVVDVLTRDTPNSGKSVFAYVFVPIFTSEGAPGGVISLFVDRSQMAAHFHALLSWLGWLIPLLCAVFYAVPSCALIFKIEQDRRKARDLNRLSQFDHLTGVFNRQTINEKLMAHYQFGTQKPCYAVFYIDVDKFKTINDEFGHDYGDAVLRHLGLLLRETVRPGDLVGRFGGDEFVVILFDATEDIVRSIANSVLKQARRPITVDGHTIQTGLSIGSRLIREGESPQSAIRKADMALYHAKSMGRNQVVEYFPELDIRQTRRRAVEARMRQALKKEEFVLHFQPIHHASNRSLVGFEALLRLNAEDGEPISPAEFIPIAEETGIIRALSQFVLRAAIQSAASWPAHLTVSVNLSPAQIAGGHLVKDISEALQDYDFPAKRLEVEITEGLLMKEEKRATLQLVELRALGVSVAMDDFGTGYSSLGYLWQFDFDKIKIDRSFIEGLDFNPQRYGAIIKMVVELGKSMNMLVTIEGVETEQHLASLDQFGCDQYQGFWFSRPMPLGETTDYIAKHAGPSRSIAWHAGH